MRCPLRFRIVGRSIVALALLGMLCGPVAAAPGGRGGARGGGGRGPGGGGTGAGQRGPSFPGGAGPGAGGGFAPGPGQGRVTDAGPRPDAGRPVEQGRVIEGGRAGGPAGRGSVENFIGAKPAAKAKSTTAQGRVDSMRAALQGRTQPFTADWYAEHPGAWQYTHPYAGWWGVAGTAGLAAWLGYSIGASSSSAVATTTATATESTAAAASATAVDSESSETSAEPPADLEWMPLGVFATGPKGTADAHIYLQLAVSRKGEIKGNYYDAVSDATQVVSGAIDRDTRKATWKVGKGAMFETTLDALTQTPSDVTMKTGAATQTWELVQMQQPKSAQP
ncbi:MAG: hypothetical protein WCC69_06425 [Pirellulales bacterium]